MALKWFETTNDLLARGIATPGANVFELYKGPFPLVLDAVLPDGSAGPRENIELVNARIYKVTMGSDDYVSVVLCKTDAAGVANWTIYCGDHQVQGLHRNDGKALANTLRKEGKVSNKLTNGLEASAWTAKVPGMANCGFFKMLERKDKFCAHTEAVLAQLNQDDLTGMAVELIDWKSGAEGPASTAVPLSEEEVVFYDAAFIQNVLLAGERGSGKSFLARQAADKYDAVYLEMQMHPSMEPWEFRAHDRALNGKVYTVMGKLAEAVYWIQKGKKVVLCMDEFLNMNPMYATTINTPLTLTANDTYLIETGRLIENPEDPGTARIETVEVPSDMLWVVATSNVGARYGLDKIAPSVRARFLIILMNTNPDRTKKILEKNLSEFGMPLELAEMFEKFITAANQAVSENTLDEEATTRLACNVIRAAYKKAKRDKKNYPTLKSWVPVIRAQLMQEIGQVVNFELGPLDEDQAARYKTLVDTCIKAK